ncbi:MAG TPA: hypothetical protein PKJ74_01570 [Chitinophagales bacterium]|nr:hypothetical protein [Chitinophagales bacterium]
MKFDYKGKETSESRIVDFINYLKETDASSLWNYMGLTVEIDPTVDYGSENVLIRWTDINEGFNDKIIYHNLVEFKKDFQIINA